MTETYVPKTKKRKHLDQSVLELAHERIRECYRRFDKVVVAFSGGKDSTVVLQLTIDIAKELGKLPVEAFFWDEEAIYPKTVEYVERVRTRGDVKLRWLCVPHKHRNACSKRELFWYPWEPSKEGLWVRQPQAFAERSLPGLVEPVPIPDGIPYLYGPEHGSVGILTGIRAAESLRRLRIVTMKVVDNWMAHDSGAKWAVQCKPVYDWTTDDVWTAPAKFGWDYNHVYDDLEKLAMSRHTQRVCPPFGEEPLQNLYAYSVLAPETWERMINRVHGARTAGRYSRSPVYGVGGGSGNTDDPQARIRHEISKWPPREQVLIAKRIQNEIEVWNTNTGNAPIPAKAKAGNFSWGFLIKIAERGDLKGRKSADKFLKVEPDGSQNQD